MLRTDRWLQQPQLILVIVINLLPAFGVLFWQWEVATLVFLYWAENVIIGAYIILREFLLAQRVRLLGKLFLLLFFLIHYGGFCAGHGVLIISLFHFGEFSTSNGGDWPFFLVFVQLLVQVLEHFYAFIEPSIYPFLFAIVGFYLWRLRMDFLSARADAYVSSSKGQAPLKKPASHWMGEPYKRIIILHVALLLGGFGIQALGSPIMLLLILIVLKIGVELFLQQTKGEATVLP